MKLKPRLILKFAAAYALTAWIIAATIVFVIVLLIANTILLPFDIAYRAINNRLQP